MRQKPSEATVPELVVGNVSLLPDSSSELRPAGSAAREGGREGRRRAVLIVVGFVGGLLIFKLTEHLDLLLSVPTPLVFALSGAAFGALCGAAQRADELEDRVLHTLVGAIVVALAFAFFSLSGPFTGPWKYPWSVR